MDSPYRIPLQSAEPPRDTGIVGDVIGQFADPLAFYRELVQNSIDAGTQKVDVVIAYDAGDGIARVAVRDAGEGMTRQIVEDYLLVMFRSTKEGDDTKIGKFGIGFKSVLAPSPRIVTVQTSRDGKRLVIHLRPDLSYELFDGGPATRAGTSVELELVMPPEELAVFVARSRTALMRWCRHAGVPVHLSARDGAGTVLADERIDRPLDLDGVLVSVRATSGDGQTVAIVGLPRDPKPYGGFFDHGLTLFESDDTMLGAPLAFKVQDPRLGHTISRDNVLRDDAFHGALRFVRGLVDRLDGEIDAAIRAAADAGDRGKVIEIATAALAAGFPGPWAMPLIEPIGDDKETRQISDRPSSAKRSMTHDIDAFVATRKSPITAALAAANVPVFDIGPNAELAPILRRMSRTPTTDVETMLSVIEPIEPTPSDLALLDEIGAVLAAAHRRPALALATVSGALGGQLSVTGDRDDAWVVPPDGAGVWLIDRKRGGRRAFGTLRTRPIILSANHPLIAAARKRAADDPVTAGSLVARQILLDHKLLDVARSQSVLDRALSRLGVGGGS
jgi:molecular chaperone HtpG